MGLEAPSLHTLIPAGTPGMPQNLTFKPASSKTSGTLSWEAAASNGNAVTRYEYRYHDGGGSWTTWEVAPGAGATAGSVTVSGLDATKSYTFEARAVNAAGAGDAASTAGSTTTTTTTVDEPGRITVISIASARPRTVGGVERMHVTEGAGSSTVSVEVEWTHDQLRSIWAAVPTGGKPAAVAVTLDMMPASVDHLAWVSSAETEAGHDDVTIGAGLTVAIPRPPTSASSRGYTRNDGLTSIAFNHDADAENEAFTIEVTNAADFEDRSITSSDVHVIEDDEPQGITLSNPPEVFYEGRSSVMFDVTAVPARVDLPLQVRFDLEDVTGQTVASGDNWIDKSIGTIPVGPAPGSKDTVTVSFDDNDMNRTDDMIKLTAEVVDYALDTGAYNEVGEKEVEIEVIDIHKLPPTTVDKMAADVDEGGEITLTYTVDRNPPETIRIPGEVIPYTSEALKITLTPGGTATADDYTLSSTVLDVDNHNGASPWEQEVTVTIEVMPDGELDMDTLTIDADVSGTVPAYGPLDERTDMTNPETSTITIKDKTPLQVEPKTEAQVDDAVKAAITRDAGDEGLNPDEMFSVALEKLFTENMGYTADYDVTTTGDAVTAKQSGGNVEVSAVAVGMSTVKVTAKASMSSATVSQTGADSAMVEFDVMVVNKKLMVTVMAEPMEIEEGGTSMITATVADRAVHADDGMVKIDLAVTGPATLSAESITIVAGAMNGSVTLTATDDDDYDDETVTVIASGSGITGQQLLTIMVTDPDEATPTVRAKADAAAKIAAAIAKVAGGAEWMVGGMVAEVEMDGLFDLDEGVTATYQGTSGDPDVVKAMTTGNTLMLTPMGAGMATITVTGADNAGGSEAAMVTHDATVILANLTMMVTVEPMTVEEGGMATITAKASRMVAMADGMVKVNLSVVGDATLSAEMIEIEADSDTGTATLTSTDDEMHEPDGETVTLIASGAGIDGNMSFDIMVTDNDAAPVDVTFTLSGPEDMNLVEGMSAELTATANAAVEEDTEIMIMRDGASTASDADFTAESIMITAGETTGTTMVMAVEDNEPDSGSGSPEMLMLYGMVNGMQTNSVSFYLWDAAVPALPVIAQLLLAAFLAVGGYRRYLRR